MKLTNKNNLPQPLYDAIANDPYESTGDISTTRLISPPQIVQLRKRHSDEIITDVSEMIFALIGNNAHYILERAAGPGSIAERRFGIPVQTSIGGWTISGQVDLYEVVPQIHSDYKITSIWAKELKPEWEEQLNVNTFLMAAEGLPVKKHQIVVMFRDWSKMKARNKDYPQPSQVRVFPAPMWGIERAGEYIERRVAFHQKAEDLPDELLPPCSAEERWERPTTYAVVKKGRKSALRVLGSEKEAAAWMQNTGKGDGIEVRPGESIRCENYCDCKPFCHQYPRIVERMAA